MVHLSKKKAEYKALWKLNENQAVSEGGKEVHNGGLCESKLVLIKFRGLLVTNDRVWKRRKYFQELIGNDGIRYVGTIGLEV